MQTTYTPGPWRVTGPNVRAGDALLAVVTDHWADEPTPDDEKAHNARLIAAAPELLGALQKIDANAAESVEWIRRVAREAISKATGGAA